MSESLRDFLNERQALIDAALRQWLPRPPRVPERLAQAMEYAVFPGGKRLRPVLTLMSCEACGGELKVALPGACALELIHCYSLIHDDLPAMDNADLRRGRPSVHRQFDEATAILAGDALLTYAFELLATELHDAELVRASVAELAQAAGPAGMVGGQMQDLEACQTAQDLPALQRLEELHGRKTGALLRSAVRLGALAARAPRTWMELLDAYAQRLGLAFQIVDDLLDVVGEPEKLGKPVHQDRDKFTFPAVLGLEEARRRAAELVDEATALASQLPRVGRWFQLLARYVLEREA
jgi:geranylgeranyl diphosphate synthase type II